MNESNEAFMAGGPPCNDAFEFIEPGEKALDLSLAAITSPQCLAIHFATDTAGHGFEKTPISCALQPVTIRTVAPIATNKLMLFDS